MMSNHFNPPAATVSPPARDADRAAHARRLERMLIEARIPEVVYKDKTSLETYGLSAYLPLREEDPSLHSVYLIRSNAPLFKRARACASIAKLWVLKGHKVRYARIGEIGAMSRMYEAGGFLDVQSESAAFLRNMRGGVWAIPDLYEPWEEDAQRQRDLADFIEMHMEGGGSIISTVPDTFKGAAVPGMPRRTADLLVRDVKTLVAGNTE